jgi:hypothetical protein
VKSLRTMIASVGAAALIAITGTGVLAAPAELSSPAADLRVALGRLLGEHAALAIEATRQGFDAGDLEDPEFVAAAGALQGNTDDLVGAIDSIYGADAAQAFRAQWEAHIGFFVDYTVGLVTDDMAAQDEAVADLTTYIEDFGQFLSDATGGNLPADAAQGALAEHVTQLKEQIDAYAAGDFETAYAKAREAYAHMFMTADALSLAIIQQNPDTFTGNDLAWSPAVDLQIALQTLLGEHAILAIEATRNGVSGAGDFEVSAGSLGANTADLTAAITSVYGADAGQAFNAQWEAHIGFFVDYTVATAGGDDAAKQQAVDDLGTYVTDFGAFLGTATEENLPTEAAQSSLEAHVGQLAGQLDQFFAEDYAAAYASEREAYEHMFMTATALAAAIAGQFPAEFPTTQEPSDTAMAVPTSTSPSPVLLIGLVLAGVAGVAFTRRAIEVRPRD